MVVTLNRKAEVWLWVSIFRDMTFTKRAGSHVHWIARRVLSVGMSACVRTARALLRNSASSRFRWDVWFSVTIRKNVLGCLGFDLVIEMPTHLLERLYSTGNSKPLTKSNTPMCWGSNRGHYEQQTDTLRRAIWRVWTHALRNTDAFDPFLKLPTPQAVDSVVSSRASKGRFYIWWTARTRQARRKVYNRTVGKYNANNSWLYPTMVCVPIGVWLSEKVVHRHAVHWPAARLLLVAA